MSEVVSALSNVTRQPRTLSGTITGILIHIFFVGIPIALITLALGPASARLILTTPAVRYVVNT